MFLAGTYPARASEELDRSATWSQNMFVWQNDPLTVCWLPSEDEHVRCRGCEAGRGLYGGRMSMCLARTCFSIAVGIPEAEAAALR